MGIFGNLFRSGGNGPAARMATVGSTTTGPLYPISRQLDPAATLSLLSGSDANLSLAGSSIAAAAALGAGVSQVALVREQLGQLAIEYPVTISTPGTVPGTYALKDIIKGDSIAAGLTAAYAGFDKVSVAGVTTLNLGVSSTTMGTALLDVQNGEVANDLDPTKPTNYIVERGTNDLGKTSITGTDLFYTVLIPMGAIARSLGAYFTVETVLPRGIGSDNNWTSAKELERLAYNALVKGGTEPVIDFVIDSASRSEFADPGNTTYFNADTLHLTTAGQDVKTGIYTANAQVVGVLPKRSPTVVVYGKPPAGTQGSPYSWTPTRVGGTGPFTYAVTAGTLPAGLTINASTGAINGTYAGSGTVGGVEISCTDAATGKVWHLSGRSFTFAASTAPAGTAIDPLTMTGASYATAKFGQGLTAGLGVVPASVVPATTTFPFSVECWVSKTSASLGVAIGAGGFFLGGDNGPYCSVNGAGLQGATGSLPDGVQHHMRLVFLSTGSTLYLDGTLVSTTTTTLGQVGQVVIGAYSTAGGYAWPYGTIDDVAFFNVDRSAAPVPTASIAPGTAGLLGVYALEGSGAGIR